jgi:hypothetical protein
MDHETALPPGVSVGDMCATSGDILTFAAGSCFIHVPFREDSAVVSHFHLTAATQGKFSNRANGMLGNMSLMPFVEGGVPGNLDDSFDWLRPGECCRVTGFTEKGDPDG